MQVCSKCILDERFKGITFNEKGECSLCASNKKFIPYGEEKLLKLFAKYKKTKSRYDALVPLSGGKDSTYILYLAIKKYNLKVLAYTYNNGFFSDTALQNIKNAVTITGVDHEFYNPDDKLLQKIYKACLLQSADICGACDIGTMQSIFYTSQKHKIPMILLGISPLEENSFVPENIQDVFRFKAIIKQSGLITNKELYNFLFYPNMNYFSQKWMTLTHKFGVQISPLFYIENPTDKEMGNILKKEMNWNEVQTSEYTKHFDCIAEPFTNYVRYHVYGYTRRICQLSNMIRNGEITRQKALEIYANDNVHLPPANTQEVLKKLAIDNSQLNDILSIKPFKFEKYTSKSDKIFAYLKKLKDNIT